MKWGLDPESVENPTLAVEIFGKRSRIQWNAEEGAYFLVNSDDAAKGTTQQKA